MNSRRIIILLVAVVIAAVASMGLLSYVRNLETEATDVYQLEEVWVVQDTIPRGTPAQQVISSGLIALQQVPVEFMPASAIKDPAVELAGLVAVTDLPPNSVVVSGNFVAPGVVNTGITDRLEERGMVTLTFSLGQVNAAAYLIQPGDYVNILTLVGLTDDEEESTDTEGNVVSADGEEFNRENDLYNQDARYVYQQAEVLAVASALPSDLGENTTAEGDEAAAGPPASGLITLALPPEAVQLMLSIGLEDLYLSLLPTNYEPQPLPPINLDEFQLPGEDPERLTPYGPPSNQPQSTEEDQ